MKSYFQIVIIVASFCVCSLGLIAVSPTVEAATIAESDSAVSVTADDPAFQPNQSNDDQPVHYVSKNGSNGDGSNWESAWNELDQIQWERVSPGDYILIDGGEVDASMVYTGTLAPTVSGTEELPITIRLANTDGRNGKAVFFGGNSIPLPECGQFSWDESEHENAGRFGILLKDGVSNLVIDGTKRGGITIHGWREAGITFDPDRLDNQIDDNPKNITLRFMEVFNNGDIERSIDSAAGIDDAILPELYYPYHGSPGVKLAGRGHRFEYMEIHDNAADAIQSNFTSPEGGVFNNIDDITVITSWLYNQRAHSGEDNSPAGEVCTLDDLSGCDEKGSPALSAEYLQYPSEPVGRREAFNWCTHNDGIQIYSSNDLNGLAIEQSILGPNLMNALILGDRGDSGAWVNDLTMNDVVVTRFTNNALGMNNDKPNVGSNWKINQSTFYGHFNKVNMGSLSLQSVAAQTEHRISNTISVFGRTEFPDGNVEFSRNCEHNTYDGSIQGVVSDPLFTNVNSTTDYFENDLKVDFASVFTEDYRSQNPDCSSAGSRLTSVSQLMVAFEMGGKESDVDPTLEVRPPSEQTELIEDNAEALPDAPAEPSQSQPVIDANNNSDEIEEITPAGPTSEELAERQKQIRLLITLSIIAFFIIFLLGILIYFLIRLNLLDEEEQI